MLYVGTFEREVALRIAKGLRSAGHKARVSVRNTMALQTHRVWIEGRKQRDAELIERAGLREMLTKACFEAWNLGHGLAECADEEVLMRDPNEVQREDVEAIISRHLGGGM